MNCGLPGSSVLGILQAKILQWVAMPSSRGSSWLKDWIHISYVSCIAGGFFTHWAMGEAHTATTPVQSIHYHLLPKSLQLSCNWSSRFCYCSSSLFLLFLKFRSDHITPLHKPFKGPHLTRIKVHVLTTTGHDISLPFSQTHLGCSCLEACSCALIFCLNYFSPKLLSSDLCSNASLTTILIPLTCFILFYTC